MLMPCPLYPATPEQRATAGKASGCARRSGTLPQRAGRQGLRAIRQAGEKGPASTRGTPRSLVARGVICPRIARGVARGVGEEGGGGVAEERRERCDLGEDERRQRAS